MSRSEKIPASWKSIRIHSPSVEPSASTGRTHQIRVHCAHVGHPLLGDHLYGDGLPVSQPAFLQRFALHARRLRFRHPVTGNEHRVEAPLPESFLASAAALRGPRVCG